MLPLAGRLRDSKTGELLTGQTTAGRGTYIDCPNIDLYEQSSDSKTTKLFAEYCLLGD
jgi:hypothetical protein